MNGPTNNKHTMKISLLFVGLDVHAQNITLGLAPGDGSAARRGGDIAHPLTTHHVTKERNLPHSLDSFHTGQAFPVSLE